MNPEQISTNPSQNPNLNIDNINVVSTPLNNNISLGKHCIMY